MITKNAKYANVENVTVLEFGKGTISVVSAENPGGKHSTVIFKTIEPVLPIGADCEITKGQTSDDYKPEIIMMFNKAESIDVVIDALNRAKEILNQYKP